MKVLVLGSGGREHALMWRLRQDADVADVVAAPGNPGMAALGRAVPVNLEAPADILALAEREAADLTVVGPEGPLERGVGDLFRRAGRPLLGPLSRAAALECSKAYAKSFMARHQIPTARFVVCDAPESAFDVVGGSEFGFPVVVKADGLAAGKGVVIAADRPEAEAAIRAAMVEKRFGRAGARVVIEECLSGPEVSFFVLSDGHAVIPLSTAQDHKRIWDGDRGPNTGGMGAFAPSPLVSDRLASEIVEQIARRVVDGMRADGESYVGFLYVSLMLTGEGPKVIEFNVRFGDPEAQVVLPLLEGRFAQTLLSAATGRLDGVSLAERGDRFVGVVLAAEGYPGTPKTGVPIHGLARAAAIDDVLVFHAGTRRTDAGIVTAGGRVLTMVGRGSSYEAAMAKAYEAAAMITFDGMQYRRDIGQKALQPVAVNHGD